MSARKRRKIDAESPASECFGEIISELDLEIALRRRVAETIESRITWALLLKESLKKGSSGSTTSFKDAALDAVSAIEAPLDVIFDREIVPVVPPIYAQPAKPPPPPLKQKAPRNPNAKFLYIRSSDLEPPYDENHVQTYLLRCPTCLRQTFTSLQGLFNHARITHRTEWGTHDECVRACAVADPDLDIGMGNEVGLGPNGILPGLRSLFNMAVGAHQPRELQAGGDVDAAVMTGGRVDTPPLTSSISRTLGIHEETPALAPFLGKQAARRAIKIYPEDTVDIESFDHNRFKTSMNVQEPSAAKTEKGRSDDYRRRWRMHFTHRNDFEPEIERKMQEIVPNPVADSSSSLEHHPTSNSGAGTPAEEPTSATAQRNHWGMTGTRFHFAARISVIDRSYWIPPGLLFRACLDVPPDKSHHITTILKRFTVSSLSNVGGPPLTTSKPPFVVVGAANEPFLARIELQFSGVPGTDGEVTDQAVNLEHWVELDPLKTSTPVIGDEQMVDIELDRGTILLPLQKGYPAIGAKAQWTQGEVSRLDYTDVLKSLVGRFPMTLKESKASRQVPPQVPYQLLPTPQFESLIPGRRKTIEWSRARALQNAYTQKIREGRFPSQNLIPLTTADVYYWLSEEGRFFRPPAAVKPKPEDIDIPGKSYVDVATHLASPAAKANLVHPLESTKSEPEGNPGRTQTMSPLSVPPQALRTPMIDILSRLSSTDGLPRHTSDSPIKDLRVADLVAAFDPKFTSAVHDIVEALKLPMFASPSRNSETLYPLDTFGTNKAQVESHLAPHATLAIAARRFVQVLVEGGVDVLKKQREAFTGGEMMRNNVTTEDAIPSNVLMPSHILHNVIARRDASSSQSDSLDIAMSECLSRLGVSAAFSGPSLSEQGAPIQESDPVAPVKLEGF
ncbi:hypothetical protein C0991_004623 [Blastosporella zonata]|nr:hypothetical protein C0991_004623 [Blastosporella zonata]